MSGEPGTLPPFEAYKGSAPYIFVSYSHRDSATVFPILSSWNDRGYRIWYDEGIDPGNEWPEEIAKALTGCASFLVFISPHAVDSLNVRNEINFAINRKKPFLAIHLAEAVLPPGLELRMGDIQAILRYRMDAEMFDRKIFKTLPRETCEEQGEAPALPAIPSSPSPPQERIPPPSPGGEPAERARPPAPPGGFTVPVPEPPLPSRNDGQGPGPRDGFPGVVPPPIPGASPSGPHGFAAYRRTWFVLVLLAGVAAGIGWFLLSRTDPELALRLATFRVEVVGADDRVVLLSAGFLVGRPGLMATTYHVVKESLVQDRRLRVVDLGSETLYSAKILVDDPERDLVLLEVEPAPAFYLPLPRPYPLDIGTTLLGGALDDRYGYTSKTGRYQGRFAYRGRSLLETTLSVILGSSGGPLVTRDGGDLLGVICGMASGPDGLDRTYAYDIADLMPLFRKVGL